MKTYKHLFENMIDLDNIERAIMKASEHKRKRDDVKSVLENLENEKVVVKDMLVSGNIDFLDYTEKECEIKEGSRQKTRRIIKPRFKYDQIIQHVLITQLKPIILKSLHPHVYGALENRGITQAAKVISKWLKNDKRGTRYCLQMDIHHCYPTVDQSVLIDKYHRIIKDDKFHCVNDGIIHECKKGIALGAPTSIWHINFLLTEFDHLISALDGVDHYLRYADDIIIFGRDKKKLHAVEKYAIKYIKEKLHQEINHNHQIFPIEWTDKKEKIHGRPLDICGFLFYRKKRILRKKRMLGITRKARKIGKKEKPTYHDARQMLSQMGWTKNANTYGMYATHIQSFVNKKKLRSIVSRVERKYKAA